MIDTPIEPLPAVNAIAPVRPTRPPTCSVPVAEIANDDGVMVVKLTVPVADRLSAEEPAIRTWPVAIPVAPEAVNVIEPDALESCTAAAPAPPVIELDAPVAETVSDVAPAAIVKVPAIDPSEPAANVAEPENDVQAPVVPIGCVTLRTTVLEPVLMTTGPTSLRRRRWRPSRCRSGSRRSRC